MAAKIESGSGALLHARHRRCRRRGWGPAGHGHIGVAQRHDDDPRQPAARAGSEVRRRDQDNRGFERILQPRPSGSPGLTEFVYTSPISVALGAEPPYLGRSFTITADIVVPQGGAEGMIITQDGRFNGDGLYLLKGRPVFTYNALALRRFRWEGSEALTPGRHTVVFDFTYDGPGIAKGGTGVLMVDSREVARQTIPHTTPIISSFDEGLDIGYDTRSGVDDRDYQVPFRLTGTINKVTFKPGPPQFTPAEEKRAAEMKVRAAD